MTPKTKFRLTRENLIDIMAGRLDAGYERTLRSVRSNLKTFGSDDPLSRAVSRLVYWRDEEPSQRRCCRMAAWYHMYLEHGGKK